MRGFTHVPIQISSCTIEQDMKLIVLTIFKKDPLEFDVALGTANWTPFYFQANLETCFLWRIVFVALAPKTSFKVLCSQNFAHRSLSGELESVQTPMAFSKFVYTWTRSTPCEIWIWSYENLREVEYCISILFLLITNLLITIRCSVKGCRRNNRKDRVSFYRFPMDFILRSKCPKFYDNN